MTLTAMNNSVVCVCGNDIIFTVGGDEEANLSEKWFITIDIKAMQPKKDCCLNRLEIGFNNMMLGVQLVSDIRGHPIEVTVTHSTGD
jgi:hypothetical protein